MPPQPLSTLKQIVTLTFGSTTISENPTLGKHVLTVIAQWSMIDGTLARMLALMLKADVEIGIAMYQALISNEARRAALRAAANASLKEADLSLFNAVMKAIKPSRDRRNEFAHHIWGKSIDLPKTLLLADPKVVTNVLVGFDAHVKDAKEVAYRPALDRSKIYIFKEKDLIEDASNAQLAGKRINTLFVALAGMKQSDAMRQWLLNEPHVRQALESLSNGTPK